MSELVHVTDFEARQMAAGGALVPGDRMVIHTGYETRDPRAGTQAQYWSPTGFPTTMDWDADAAIRWQYIANTYVYRCVDAIATAIARCPIRAGKDAENKSEFDPKSGLAHLLGPPPGSPNPNLTPRQLWRWTVAQRLVTGRYYWEIEKTGQEVVGLWPLPSARVRPTVADGGRDYFKLFTFEQGGKKVEFKSNDIMFGWDPALYDVRQAESRLEAAKLDVAVAVMQDRYDVAFLKNDARPAAVIVHEVFENRQEREAFRQQFLAEYRGVDNAGRPIFVEATEGTDEINTTFHIERLGLSQKDSEFIARYDAKIRAICIAFGTPLSILGDSSARTFDNAGQEYKNWWEGTLLPLMEQFTDEINMRLAPLIGDDVCWFDTTEVHALKSTSKVFSLGAGVTAMVQAGILTEDEVRAEYDLPPLEEVLTPEQKTLLDAKNAAALAGAQAAANPVPAPTPPEGDPNAPAQPTTKNTAGATGAVDPKLRRAVSLDEWEVRDVVNVIHDENGIIVLEREPAVA